MTTKTPTAVIEKPTKRQSRHERTIEARKVADLPLVVLADAVTSNHSFGDEIATHHSEGGKGEVQPLIVGELTLYTHDYQGNIVLELNEVADWSYERLE